VSLSEWLRRIFFPFAVTRAALLIVGVLALGLMGSVRERMPGNLVAHEPRALPLEIWARWDAEWYLYVADQGYVRAEPLSRYAGRYVAADTAGFFPLYPLLIRSLSALGLDPVLAGVLISNLSLLGALTLLHRLAADRFSEEAANASLWGLVAFPTSLFLSAVYSESLFLALLLGCFLAARRRRWEAVLVLGFLCALCRPAGFLVAVPLAWEVLEGRGGWRGWGSLLGFPAGLGSFSFYCARKFGDPLAWAHRQERWRGAWSGPWRAFQRFFEQPPQLHGAHNSIVELVAALLFLSALPVILRRFPRSWATHALLSVLVPLGSTLWSFSRLSLAAFPFHVLAGEASRRRPGFLLAYLGLCLPLSGLLMAMFACGWWVG
jgi:hypothetical protein